MPINLITEQLAMVGRRLFERRLTDMAGGNISALDGDIVYMSPRYSGSRQHWQLDPSDFISGSLQNDELSQNPKFSREGRAHLSIYRKFPDVKAVIHAHPFHVMPFAAASRPIQPVLESTEKFGVIDVVPFAPAHSEELAAHIVASFYGKEDRMRKQAAAVLLPTHGIIVAGKDLLNAIDAVERIDTNCWCILAQRLLD